MILAGVAVEAGPEAVVVTADHDLAVVSSAPEGGGVARARSIVNVHVAKDFDGIDGARTVDEVARRRGLPGPWVGLLTSAWTDRAEMASATAGGITALVVATVGLSNTTAAGVSPRMASRPAGTINVIVVVDAAPAPAALVNLVMTVTEVKTAVLVEAKVLTADGVPATGTSTDAVVVAATGRGPDCRFGGPATDLGWAVGRAAREALGAGVRRWQQANA